jgi:hypothetical protein
LHALNPIQDKAKILGLGLVNFFDDNSAE